MTLPATPSQTVGPFFHIGLDWLRRTELFGPDAPGRRISVAGQVLDGDGRPVEDAVLEVWQADAEGRYAHPEDPRGAGLPAAQGFGRIPTDASGRYRFDTVLPGQVPGPEGRPQAPHVVVSISMRGLLRHLVTRIYFPGQPANLADPVLALVDPERRATLVAERTGDPAVLRWDVVLQGDRETVFLDL